MTEIPRVLISAVASGSGKTTITCGILQGLKNRGIHCAAFKSGPDYIDPMFHRQVLGVDSYNLDTFLCGRIGVKKILQKHGVGREICVMEGVMGYYDGVAGISTDASAYDVADTTNTPVILIIDCKGTSVSVAAVIQGFMKFRENSHIKGVILNRLSPMLYERMKKLIQEEVGVQVLGYVPKLDESEMFESRYLGLKMPGEIRLVKERLEVLGEKLSQTIDLDAILELARSAPDMEKKELEACQIAFSDRKEESEEKIQIAVARDEAFCFLYPDNLQVLEEMGAEIIEFSPIHDRQLPEKIDGLILPGGYPELYTSELERNMRMRQEIRRIILEKKVPCIAECGGFMYLQETITDEAEMKCEMAGALPGDSARTSSLRRFGYITMSSSDGEKPVVFGKLIDEIRAHEFHYYDSELCGEAFTAKKPLSNRNWKCMYSTDTLLAGYPHIHYIGNEGVAAAFVAACREERRRRCN